MPRSAPRLWPAAIPMLWLAACSLGRSGTAPAIEDTSSPASSNVSSSSSSAGGGATTSTMMTTSTTTGGGGGGGTCNGPGDCAPASCVDPDNGMLIPAETCEPTGCSTEVAAACPNGLKCSGTACLTGCSTSADCVAGNFCNTNTNACTPLLAQGDACTFADSCPGSCVDGVCCDTECDGDCESCLATDTGGTDGSCDPIPAWTDPATECNGTDELSCNGAAACAMCGDNIDAPGDAMVPAICDTVDMVSKTCFITPVDQEFNAVPLNCPANWHCDIDCTATDSCRNTTITCPSDYACTINCPTNDECKDTTIECPTNGTCNIVCGNDACEGGTVNCGNNDCSVDCANGDDKTPVVVGGAACNVTTDCP